MNEGIFQSSPVQQMVAAGGGGNNWFNTNGSSQHHSLLPAAPPLTPPLSWPASQELPHSWSQLVLGFAGEEDKAAGIISHKNMEIWEQQILSSSSIGGAGKHHNPAASYGYGGGDLAFTAAKSADPPMVSSSSPPISCVTTSTITNYSNKSSEILSKNNMKKSKMNPTISAQSGIKVRKEKLGDRITALHQIVSPFGKTDTASVLLEAIGYIRFLQRQIEALSQPYLGSESRNITHQQPAPPVKRERTSLFPEDPGQLLNENQRKRKAISKEECEEELKKDLKSRGLCLVPLSCTVDFGSENGADYWAPSFAGDFQ